MPLTVAINFSIIDIQSIQHIRSTFLIKFIQQNRKKSTHCVYLKVHL
nr:MAG TPA: hypothetical protein [Caudoviricetes sp.]DAK77679.1 MAG TPA: hypothetical protein [Caudoviricetes sp.]